MVEGQIEQLSAAIVNSAGSDIDDSTIQRTTIQTGVQYPSRALAINPGNPVGALEATDPQPVVISGLDKSSKADGKLGFNTTFINYQPNYNMLSEETEISLEYSMILKDYSESNNIRPVSTEGMFSDHTVNLVLMNSNLSERRMSTVVTTQKTGQWDTTVSSGETATITLPTTLPKSQWQDLVDKHSYAKLEKYEDNSPDINRTTISLKNGTTIKANKLSVGEPGTDSDGFDIKPYIENVTQISQTVDPGRNASVTVRTVDEFDGPLSGIDVQTTNNGSGNVVPKRTESNGSGKASFVYVPVDSDNGSTVGVTASLPNRTGPNSSVMFELEYPPERSNNTSNETSREPLNVNNLQRGRKTLLKFKTTPGSPINVSGFSITTKSEASALNETGYTHQFQLTRSQRIRGVSSGNELRYASGEPIQFDGQDYTFIGGPRRVTSSEVILEGWQWAENVQINDFTDSYEDADIVVYLITENGKRPVYIDAMVAGSSTSTANSTTTNTTTTTATNSSA